MNKNLQDTLCGGLKAHATLVGAGMPSTQASELLFHKDLSITIKPAMTLTETYQQQLSTIGKSIEINLDAILNMATTEQLVEVIAAHEGISWEDPDDSSNDFLLVGLTKDPITKAWFFDFEDPDSGLETSSYELKYLTLTDALCFLGTLESVILPTFDNIKNTFKS